MQRAFAIDVLACSRCGGRLRLIATVHDPRVIRQILAHLPLARLGQSLAPPQPIGAPLARRSEGGGSLRAYTRRAAPRRAVRGWSVCLVRLPLDGLVVPG